MSTLNFVPYEDPVGFVPAESEKVQGGATRKIIGKTFGQDLPHATPRRALGDVKNVALHQSASTVKKPQQSIRKLATANSNVAGTLRGGNSVSRLSRPVLSTKPSTKKNVTDTQMPQEREQMFPFMDQDSDFEMPSYLSAVLTGRLIENSWWPDFTQHVEKLKPRKFDIDLREAQLEELPLHTEIEEPIIHMLSDDLTNPLSAGALETDFLELGKSISLGELERDLEEIDAFYGF